LKKKSDNFEMILYDVRITEQKYTIQYNFHLLSCYGVGRRYAGWRV